MTIDPKKIVAALNPDIFCEPSVSSKVKALVKEKGYLEAAKEAKLKPTEYLDIIHTRFTEGAFKMIGTKFPIEQHKLSYDVFSQSLEPIYFWILDYIMEEYKRSEKLIDNFVSSAGSGHFAELQQRATRMQEEAMKMFGTANTVLRSIMNIIYDLKDFKLRLAQYEDYHSQDPKIKSASFLALKQIWLDSVDIKRGNSSIKALGVSGANQPNFVTLIDAFMAVRNLDDLKEMDLNLRVKRILEQRISEFLHWIEISETELKKRFEIEKTYLRSQVNTLKLYSRWIKPYLKAAKDLEQRTNPDTTDLISTFNSAIFELSILGIGEYKWDEDVEFGILPKAYKKLKLRIYLPVVIVEFRFRSAPDRTDQRGGYGYRGKADITFTGFALNEEEIKKLKELIEKDDVGDLMQMISGATTESLEQIQGDIDEFLEGKKQEKKEEDKQEDSNPFTALFSFMKREKKESKKGELYPDTEYEKVLRSQASLEGRWQCRKLYDAFKKSIGMPAFPPTM